MPECIDLTSWKPDVYPWAKRHPWMSWLERYKKNQDTFDPSIESYVRKYEIDPMGKGTYRFKRKEYINGTKVLYHKEFEDEAEDGEEVDEDEDEQQENEADFDALGKTQVEKVF